MFPTSALHSYVRIALYHECVDDELQICHDLDYLIYRLIAKPHHDDD